MTTPSSDVLVRPDFEEIKWRWKRRDDYCQRDGIYPDEDIADLIAYALVVASKAEQSEKVADAYDATLGAMSEDLAAAASRIETLETERDEALHGRADSDGWADQFRAERDRAEADLTRARAERDAAIGHLRSVLPMVPPQFAIYDTAGDRYDAASSFLNSQDRNPEVTRDE